MELRKSRDGEVGTLAAISKAAFDSDVKVGASALGGPPGYDSVHWHSEQQRRDRLYTFADGERVIGGAILFPSVSTLYIGRIFINPAYFRQGYGIELMRRIEGMFPEVGEFKLDTPVFNVRTLAFYKKCGYKEVSRDCESVYFRKAK